ncbi:MAG: LysR family transcriptional regulator [Alphaproteobacteria bacterium]|nr:LysR family transcriptional regulator [Alphaproteobacteria bacterium]
MDWDKLRIFHAVAEAGSLTQAAKMLGSSQPAISRNIAALESDLGTALFRRHARGLVLSEQGEILHAETADIFERLLILQSRLKDTQNLPEGPLTITVSEFIGTTWLASKLAAFHALYPHIQLTVLFDDRVLKLNMKEADVAIRLIAPHETDVIQRYLTAVRFHICGHRDYFKENGSPKRLSDLRNHCLIGYPQNVTGAFANPNWLFDIAKTDVQHDHRLIMINSMTAIYEAVMAKAGIAVLPDYIIASKPELQVVLPRLERPPVDMYFVYAKERKNAKRTELFRDFLLEHIRQTKFSADFH